MLVIFFFILIAIFIIRSKSKATKPQPGPSKPEPEPEPEIIYHDPDKVHEFLDKYLYKLDTVTNRLSISIFIGSIVISSSLLTLAGAGPTIYTIPVLGIIGYSIAALLGIWLVVAIFRSGRL